MTVGILLWHFYTLVFLLICTTSIILLDHLYVSVFILTLTNLLLFLFPHCVLLYEQKYPPSATTLHFEFYAEPGPEVKVDRKVKVKQS